MAIIDTLFMTKTAEKTNPLGRTYLYSPYMGVLPRGRGAKARLVPLQETATSDVIMAPILHGLAVKWDEFF